MRSPLILRIFLATALLAFVGRAFAQEVPYPAILDLTLNHLKKGSLFVLLGENDVWVSVADFQDLGVQGFGGTRETFNGKEYVSLKSLSPGMVYAMDENAGTLMMTIQPRYLGTTTRMNFSNSKPEHIPFQKSTSFFLITR